MDKNYEELKNEFIRLKLECEKLREEKLDGGC